MRNATVLALLVATAAAALPAPARAQRSCMVSDPTGTPLNVRVRPNGPIVGALYNGARVRRLDTVLDDRGRPWSLIQPEASGRGGWVFREFVSCL